jgi:hypothetical protein
MELKDIGFDRFGQRECIFGAFVNDHCHPAGGRTRKDLGSNGAGNAPAESR